MIKNLQLAKFSLPLLSLVSTSAFAHAGHLANDTIHGFLHVEHIIVITAIGFIAYFLCTSRRK